MIKLISIFISINILYSMNCHQIITFQEVEDILSEKSMNFSDYHSVNEGNLAFIYNIDERFIVIPNNYSESSKCLLLKNRDCLDQIVETGIWPPIDESSNIFAANSHFIQNFSGQEVLTDFVQGQGYEFSDNYDDLDSLNFIFSGFRSTYKSYDQIEKMKAVIALGEVYRKYKNGEWILIKYHLDYNHYWVPAVKVGHKVNLVFDFLDRYFTSSFNIETLFRLQWNENPPLELNGINKYKFLK